MKLCLYCTEYSCGSQGSYNISEKCGDHGTYFHSPESVVYYPIFFTPNITMQHDILVFIPDFKIYTEGYDIENAIRMAKDAIINAISETKELVKPSGVVEAYKKASEDADEIFDFSKDGILTFVKIDISEYKPLFEIEEPYDFTEPGKYIYRGFAHCYNSVTHEYQKVKMFVHSDQMMIPPQSMEAEEKREIDLSFWNRIRHADEARKNRKKEKKNELFCD